VLCSIGSSIIFHSVSNYNIQLIHLWCILVKTLYLMTMWWSGNKYFSSIYLCKCVNLSLSTISLLSSRLKLLFVDYIRFQLHKGDVEFDLLVSCVLLSIPIGGEAGDWCDPPYQSPRVVERSKYSIPPLLELTTFLSMCFPFQEVWFISFLQAFFSFQQVWFISFL